MAGEGTVNFLQMLMKALVELAAFATASRSSTAAIVWSPGQKACKELKVKSCTTRTFQCCMEK